MSEELTDEEIQVLKQNRRDQKYQSAIIVGSAPVLMLYILIAPLLNIQTFLQPHMPELVFAAVAVSLIWQYYKLNIEE